MGWAARHIEKLKQGQAVTFRPYGNSMAGLVNSGQLVTVEPLGTRVLGKRDIVLCRVNGREYLHLIVALNGPRVQIGNNRGGINGWVTRAQVFGICTKVED